MQEAASTLKPRQTVFIVDSVWLHPTGNLCNLGVSQLQSAKGLLIARPCYEHVHAVQA